MAFETFFRLISYTAVFCGFFSLWVSGSFGIGITGIFIGVMIAAWFLEDTKRQISEKIGTTFIVLALPAFFGVWWFGLVSFHAGGTEIAGVLARLILSLTAIKLLQQKSSRDWVFLYLMSFFEVMLAAGLSISALYLASFMLYLLVMVCAIVTFEIRKTSAAIDLVTRGTAREMVALPISRLPAASVILLVLIAMLALPMFFTLPRVGGAGFGGSQTGLSTFSGFSDTVRLGGVGLIQENDAVVMRVKLENETGNRGLYFRGIILDTFDNKAWSRSRAKIREPFERGERDLIQLDNATSRNELSVQTIYLEPLDTPVLFALPRAILVQSNFPVLYKDVYGAISFTSRFERTSYKVLSDRSLPTPEQLRADNAPYPANIRPFRQLPPSYDTRIASLAEDITVGYTNRYDKARAIESYLQTNFGYTLEQKSGGPEPLADFLFNVREGHCEYFATAMAVMLRTQGIATRIVNGFHGGEYNDAAGVTIVRERNAHAWVEVYFPAENAWVPFDPTPAAGLNPMGAGTGLTGAVRKYIEALETFWIQYFVAFDDQEQRSLTNSVRSGIAGFQISVAAYLEAVSDSVRSWWADVQGVGGNEARMYALARLLAAIIGVLIGVFLVKWAVGKLQRSGIWRRLGRRLYNARAPVIVEFYERMQTLLTEKGYRREPFQTPLEFASGLNMPEAVMITNKYNGVRFGEKDISQEEAIEIELWLQRMKSSAS